MLISVDAGHCSGSTANGADRHRRTFTSFALFGEIDKALAGKDCPGDRQLRINGDVELPIGWEIAQNLELTE